MNKMKSTLCLLASISLVGCQVEAEQTAQATDEQTAQEQQTSDSSSYGDNIIQVGSVALELTDELITELQSQPTINDQFMVLYDNFEPLLDRSESLTGPDSNDNGIRDDIEAFIDALQVEEPIRKAIKQNAKFQQKNLYYDFDDSENNELVSLAISIALEYEKVSACQKYVGINIDDRIAIGRTITALSYNTKLRTLAYIKYNRNIDGLVSTSLRPVNKYCD